MNWGIIGYGEIAPSFIECLSIVNGQRLNGIASISKNKKLREQNIDSMVNVYSSYEELFANPEIDVIYISTTNNLHKQNVLSALKSGKHVLCEKPIGISRADVNEMVAEAQSSGKFLMEGMWTRFLPAYKHFKNILTSGTIGSINFARVDFGFYSNWSDDRRLKNPHLCGGAILDNTDYNVFLSQDIFRDKPSSISAIARYYKTGVEDMCAVTLQYPNGSIAQLFSSFHQRTNQEALIYGDKGHIHLKSFWNGTHIELHTDEGLKTWDFPFRINGFEYEIEEVISCINNCQIESNTIPHKLSIDIAEIMDEIIIQTKK
jgi:predicted dehydrogenase